MSGPILTISTSSSSHVVLDVDNLNTPLHIAASIGLFESAQEILTQKIEFALCINKQGLTPLHIACANGHLLVVKVLIGSKAGHELCRVLDKDGMLPIHTAAARGRADVMHELMGVCSETTVREKTRRGDNILHLAVKSDNIEASKFLVERLGGDIEFLKSVDAEGNTAMHLATARNQLEIVKILLDKCGQDNLNARNKRGLSILDVVLEPPRKNRNAVLEEMIRTAGGTTTNYKCRMRVSKLLGRSEQLWQRLMPSSAASLKKEQEELQAWDCDQHRGIQKTLMIVSVLLATITFQAAMTPPKPFKLTNSSEEEKNISSGVLNAMLRQFLLYDIIVLVTSLSTILVMICGRSQWKYMTRLMLWMTWTAVYFTLLAFIVAVRLIYGSKDQMNLYTLEAFLVTMTRVAMIIMGYLIFRLQLYVLSKLKRMPCVKLQWIRCLRKINMISDLPSYDLRCRALLLVRRVCILTMLMIIPYYFCISTENFL